MSSEEKRREIPKQLNSNDCMYVKADKHDHVVILHVKEYNKILYQLIDEDPYRMTLQNPLNEMINEAKNGIHLAPKNLNLSQFLQYSLKVSNLRVPEMHGLAKIHKPGNKMQIIISNISSATEFCPQVKDVTLHRNELLVSFDVISLFPKLPLKICSDGFKKSIWMSTS
jgi:hypothetical protein